MKAGEGARREPKPAHDIARNILRVGYVVLRMPGLMTRPPPMAEHEPPKPSETPPERRVAVAVLILILGVFTYYLLSQP